MSHMQNVTKPKYSSEAVEALMKKNALAEASGQYITPIPEGNGNTFLKEAKKVLSDHVDSFIADPKINRDSLLNKLVDKVDGQNWSKEEKRDVKFAAVVAIGSVDRQMEFLTNFDKGRSAA